MSEQGTSRFAHRCGLAFLLFSVCLWVTTTMCYLGTWDQVAAITVFPQWSWALAGGLSAALPLRLLKNSNRTTFSIIILWLLTTLAFADNLLPVIRSLWPGSARTTRN